MSKAGTRTAGEGRVIRDAVERGWRWIGRTGTNHPRLQWPATGAIVTIPSKMDDGFARRIDRQLRKAEARETL